MMKLGSGTGSLQNHVFSRTQSVAPKVGMGATILCWSDRHAATVVYLCADDGTRPIKTIHVQQDIAVRQDKNGMSEAQEYTYQPNQKAPIQIFRMTKSGWRDKGGNHLLIGIRDEYYDFSF